MVYYNRSKNELLVLTGAVYSFVAYLTAFTLEVLFIIDLAKRTSNGLIPIATNPISSVSLSSSSASLIDNEADNNGLSLNQQQTAFDQAKTMFETMQSHMTISCLAVSILYFIIFVASLVLISALILRSTFFLLVWICAMTTMYLPEFGLIIYVSVYGWGMDTRNGQTELMFYLLRAALNVIFIFRAHRLYKDWNYEKNFFILKGSVNGGSRFCSTGHNSPYFIGDSLTTTINPVFSSSSLNLDRYDHIRDLNNYPEYDFPEKNFPNTNRNHHSQLMNTPPTLNLYNLSNTEFDTNRVSNKLRSNHVHTSQDISGNRFFDGRDYLNRQAINNQNAILKRSPGMHLEQQQARKAFGRSQIKQHSNSMLSINDSDDFTNYEMDLDYRTLSNQHHHYNPDNEHHQQQQQQQQQRPNHHHHHHHHHQQQQFQHVSTIGRQQAARGIGRDIANSIVEPNQTIRRSPGSLSYSTQSLDRRHLRDSIDFNLQDQVTLRPLGHQPFEYLKRPGSTSNLTSSNNLNTQPTTMSTIFSSNAKLHDLHNRYT